MGVMRLKDAVVRDREIVSGTLCFAGTRVPVSTLFAYLERDTLAGFYEDFPGVTPQMVEAVLDASEHLVDESVPLPRTA